jgi:hypothetical protein
VGEHWERRGNGVMVIGDRKDDPASIVLELVLVLALSGANAILKPTRSADWINSNARFGRPYVFEYEDEDEFEDDEKRNAVQHLINPHL